MEVKNFHLLKFVITDGTFSENLYFYSYVTRGQFGPFYFKDKYE